MSEQDELTQRYRAARAAWRLFPSLRAAARTLGMNQRQYCDAFVALRPIVRLSVSDATTDQPMFVDPNRAYREARR